MSYSPTPDYLRSWFPTQEDYDATSDGFIDARVAWLHFEPLWTSLGYTVCYGDEKDCPPRKTLVDAAASRDSFHPTPTGPFVHSLPERFDAFVTTRGEGWRTGSPRIAFAYDSLNRLVVIKALESSDASEREISIIKYLNTPELRSSPKNHTIPILGQVEAEGWKFLIMPAWNITCEPFLIWQVDDYFEMVIQTFEGLAFMHEHGIAHRDVSVNNVVFDQDGSHDLFTWDVHPMVSTWSARLGFIDFGLSKRFPTETDSSTWVTSEWGGTHLAPEIHASRENPTDYQVLPADVYALATIWKRWLDWETRITESFKTNPLETTGIDIQVYARQALERHVPEFSQLLREAVDENPANRPTACDIASRFRVMREATPAHIRFAPSSGYPADLI